jgi:hypothetical protein
MLPQLSQKMMIDSEVVNIESKIIISFHYSKSETLCIPSILFTPTKVIYFCQILSSLENLKIWEFLAMSVSVVCARLSGQAFLSPPSPWMEFSKKLTLKIMICDEKFSERHEFSLT